VEQGRRGVRGSLGDPTIGRQRRQRAAIGRGGLERARQGGDMKKIARRPRGGATWAERLPAARGQGGGVAYEGGGATGSSR